MPAQIIIIFTARLYPLVLFIFLKLSKILNNIPIITHIMKVPATVPPKRTAYPLNQSPAMPKYTYIKSIRNILVNSEIPTIIPVIKLTKEVPVLSVS